MQLGGAVAGSWVTAAWARLRSVWWATGAIVATAVIVVCAARAIHAGVQLIDERALFEIRARDVFGRRAPLLGLRSSAGGTDDGFNHLGPSLFWWLAIPVRVWSGPVAVTIGITALNVASVWCATTSARHAAGRVVAFSIGAAATALTWSLGSDLLLDPWQPNALVLPCFALLATTAAVAAGRWVWLPVAVTLASICALTHLGYVLLAPAMVVTAIWCIAVRVLRSEVGERHWPRRPLVLSAVIAVVVWSPVIWQQLAGPGAGNVTAVLSGAGGDDASRTGLGIAVRLWADVTAIPPAWFPPTYESPPQAVFRTVGDEVQLDTSQLPMTWLAVSLLAVGIVLVARELRHRVGVITTGYVTVALVATVVAIATIAVLPADLFGVVAHKYRYLWSLAAFCTAVVVAHVVTVMHGRWTAPVRHAAAVAGVVAVIVVGFMATATRPIDDGQFSSRQLWPALASVRDQLGTYRPDGVVEVETNNLAFPDYYSHAVLAQLSTNGVDFQVTSPTMVGQLGPSRAADGTATTRIIIDQSDAAGPAGARTLARINGASAPDVHVYEIDVDASS